MLNEKLVTQPSNTHAYRAYIETLTHYGKEAMTTQLTEQLFYKDEAGKLDIVNPLADAAEVNVGLKKRHGFIAKSKTVSMLGPIYADVFFQERLLVPGVDVKLKLNRTRTHSVYCRQIPQENTRSRSRKPPSSSGE